MVLAEVSISHTLLPLVQMGGRAGKSARPILGDAGHFLKSHSCSLGRLVFDYTVVSYKCTVISSFSNCSSNVLQNLKA